MVDRNCAKTVAREGGFSLAEVEGLADEIRARSAAGQKPEQFMPEVRKNLERDKFLKARNAAFNRLRLADMKRRAREFRRGDAAEAILAMGHGREAAGSRSAMALAQSKAADWANALMLEVKKAGDASLSDFISGRNTRDVYRAIYAARQGQRADVAPAIQRVADAIVRTQDSIVSELNAEGAFIGRMDDYITRQYHDPEKIARRRGETADEAFNRWWLKIEKNLDFERSFGVSRDVLEADPALRKKFMERMRQTHSNLSAGVHTKAGDEAGVKGVGTGGGNIARQASAERTLHFKDADAFYEYQLEFGNTNLGAVMRQHIGQAARTYGILRTFGPNYRQNIQRLINDLDIEAREAGDQSLRESLKAKRAQIDRMVDEMDGSLDAPADRQLAVIGSGFRTIVSTSKLGGAFLSALTDVANIAAELTYQGAGFLDSYWEYAKRLIQMGKDNTDLDAWVQSLGIALDVYRGTYTDEFATVDGMPGKLTATQNIFGRMSLLTESTNAAKRGFVVLLADHVGRHASLPMDQLPKGLRDILNVADIRQVEWEAIRRGARQVEIEGRDVRVLEPQAMRDLPDEVIDQYLGAKGRKATPFARQQARRDLEDMVRAYYQDSVKSAVLESKPEGKTKMRQGHRRGTWVGEAWAMIMQFKSFPIAAMRQRGFRQMRASIDAPLSPGFRGAAGDLLGNYRAWGLQMAGFAAQMTAMGYLAMSVKDVFKNRTPQDPRRAETWMAALAQGGGAGIFGDFLFGDVKNRIGGSFAETLAGPWTAPIGDLADLWGRARSGDDTAGAAIRTLVNNVPFANLFYARWAIQHFFVNAVSEELNPGATRRYYQMLEDRTGQRPLFTP